MNPVIRQFPSSTFYDNKITDDNSIFTREIAHSIRKVQRHFAPTVFFDLANSQETLAETSKSNTEEA